MSERLTVTPEVARNILDLVRERDEARAEVLRLRSALLDREHIIDGGMSANREQMRIIERQREALCRIVDVVLDDTAGSFTDRLSFVEDAARAALGEP